MARGPRLPNDTSGRTPWRHIAGANGMRDSLSEANVSRLKPALQAMCLCAALWNGCGGSRPADIAADIARIRAVDDHAHPVRVGEGDREFDALPVDNMEPPSDPVYLRPGAPGILEAWRALFGYSYTDLLPEHAHAAPALKRRAIEREGDGYPAWVLDQMGV